MPIYSIYIYTFLRLNPEMTYEEMTYEEITDHTGMCLSKFLPSQPETDNVFFSTF